MEDLEKIVKQKCVELVKNQLKLLKEEISAREQRVLKCRNLNEPLDYSFDMGKCDAYEDISKYIDKLIYEYNERCIKYDI